MNIITSFSNPKIKDVIKLRESNYRRTSCRFLIDGFREIERAALGGVCFCEFFVSDRAIDLAKKFSRRNNVTINIVPELLIQKIGFGNRNDGIVAVAEMPDGLNNLDDNFPNKSANQLTDFKVDAVETNNKSAAFFCDIPLFVVLEGIEKPGNIGAVFRSADGVGVSGIILADLLTDLYNPNTIRASLGTLFNIPVVSTTGLRAKDWLLKRDIKLAVAKCGGEFAYTKYDFCKPTAVVLGSESEGLTKIWNGKNITAITIPMNGIADSLNISAAAAVILYEAKRQRTIYKEQ
jgi:TrmH family RNA methyltransferase